MNKPTLVLITSKRCSPCIQFKESILPKLKDKLEREKIVNFVHLETAGFDYNFFPKGYNPQIKKFVKEFPSMFIFDSSDWNNHSVDLKGDKINIGYDVNALYSEIETKVHKFSSSLKYSIETPKIQRTQISKYKKNYNKDEGIFKFTLPKV